MKLTNNNKAFIYSTLENMTVLLIYILIGGTWFFIDHLSIWKIGSAGISVVLLIYLGAEFEQKKNYYLARHGQTKITVYSDNKMSKNHRRR